MKQRKTEKPEVRVVVMRDGKIRIINGQQGAKFCKVKPASFAAFIRRNYRRGISPPRPSVAERVLNAYPELFSNKHKGTDK